MEQSSNSQQLTYQGPGMRIDKRLSTQLPYSRSFFGHLFERKMISVGDRLVKKSYKVKNNDVVHIGGDLDRFVDGGVLDECLAWDIEIKLEKEDYLVVYKPKGVLSHPNSVRDMQFPSVVGGVYHYIRKKTDKSMILPTTGSFIRAGLIHRLDKATSGRMIVVKTEKGLAHFKSLFQQKSGAESIEEKEDTPLKKFYKATSQVTLEGQEFIDSLKGKLPHYIVQDVVPKVPNPSIKEGITKIHKISTGTEQGTVELDIEILTGRTHQIRYHLSEAGLPIVGDYLYGEDADEMLLQAYRLEFIDTEGEIIIVEGEGEKKKEKNGESEK